MSFVWRRGGEEFFFPHEDVTWSIPTTLLPTMAAASYRAKILKGIRRLRRRRKEMLWTFLPWLLSFTSLCYVGLLHWSDVFYTSKD